METHEIMNQNATEEDMETVMEVTGKKWRDCTPAEHHVEIAEAAVQNIPDRWLFDERELASALKRKHPLVYPDYVAALGDWIAEWPLHVREIYPRVLAGLDRDRGCYSSPFFHFTSSDTILSLDGRTIRQSRLRFWMDVPRVSWKKEWRNLPS